ncbi:hypothetical protein [Shinella sumterensis]|uniref:hypothetical protein n=1 Tax=Shinella sumterensis TaxID=1967501 RepID=UPI003F82E043
MKALIRSTMYLGLVLLSSQADAACSRFTGSTMKFGGGPAATWRTDYPLEVDTKNAPPWASIDFITEPAKYMDAVLSTVRTDFAVKDDLLVANEKQHNWWISPWMDYTNAGRERRMGLTNERGPKPGDLSPTNRDGYQVWAVGFYNAPGATVFGSIFEDECNPKFPTTVRFPDQTASVKFLFTNASPDEVTYLKGAPEFTAFINPDTAPGQRPEIRPEKREPRTLRLLQVDIAIRDPRADATDWVFGTFIWRGPSKGDRFFDNMVPASLQWGNDPGVYDRGVNQSWVNPVLKGVIFGWNERPFLGFNGRANGPADNLRSSCLSCHSTARSPAGHLRQVDGRFDMDRDYHTEARVREHVDTWFRNIRGNELFLPNEPATTNLDYSLQLDSAIVRLCTACITGELSGPTPEICRGTAFQTTLRGVTKQSRAMCSDNATAARLKATPFSGSRSEFDALTTIELPRQ